MHNIIVFNMKHVCSLILRLAKIVCLILKYLNGQINKILVLLYNYSWMMAEININIYLISKYLNIKKNKGGAFITNYQLILMNKKIIYFGL